jgi:hypothetical protein
MHIDLFKVCYFADGYLWLPGAAVECRRRGNDEGRHCRGPEWQPWAVAAKTLEMLVEEVWERRSRSERTRIEESPSRETTDTERAGRSGRGFLDLLPWRLESLGEDREPGRRFGARPRDCGRESWARRAGRERE